jgi:7,8-dihydropterin-6-yl-methyl-4-(beta-D-ribofuranosyl)aminobenzene 5'-phosphate synthase
MMKPHAVDSLEVIVIVDNATDSLSSNPAGVDSEWQGLFRRGRMRVLGGTAICCAHHGLSLLLRASDADGTHDLLFDAGPEEATFLRNAALLGIDFGAIESVVLSHGHWDHAGGLPAAIAQIAQARGGQRVTCHVHPGMIVHRGIRLPSGVVVPMADVASPEELARAGAAVVNTAEPQLVGDGSAFYLSGEIPRRTAYEKGFPVTCAAPPMTVTGSRILSSWTSGSWRCTCAAWVRSSSPRARTAAS